MDNYNELGQGIWNHLRGIFCNIEPHSLCVDRSIVRPVLNTNTSSFLAFILSSHLAGSISACAFCLTGTL